MQMTKGIYQDAKSGKRRKAGSLILYSLLLLYAFGALGMVFFLMSSSLCEPLHALGYDWLYFALMSSMAAFMGIIGSVFTTYSGLYQGKDNETLLSMPIPPALILLVRMLSCYIMTFFFEFLVMVPMEAAWIMLGLFSAPQFIIFLLFLFLLPLFTLAISCILGWLIALAAGHVRNKSLVTVVLSLVFLIAYFYVYSQASRFLTLILNNADQLATTVHKAFYPVYMTGVALTGDWINFVLVALIYLAFFAIVYWIIAATFLRLATAGSKVKRREYIAQEKMSTASVKSALLRKEFMRLKSSPTYLMNGALGTLLMPVAAILLVVKRLAITDALSIFTAEISVVLIVAAVIGFTTSMNALTAPSVSLEGKSLWILQSLPVNAWDVLKSKMRLHMILTLPAALILAVTAGFVFSLTPVEFILLIVFTVLITFFGAVFGLALNLKHPNLNWTNEAVAVKQSASALLTIFGQWGLVILFGVLYGVIGYKLGPVPFFIGVIVLTAAVLAILLTWIRKRGTVIFERL